MRVITADQGSPEWFAARLGIPTGSGYSNVLAKGEGKTRKAYMQKLAWELYSGEVEDGFKSQAMTDGTAREPEARSLYEMRRDVLVAEVGFCRHDTIDTGVSPDGLLDDDGMIEIKCPTRAVHREYMDRKTEPTAYTAQIQGQLWVTGRSWCDFVSYYPAALDNAKLVIRRVYRDEKYIANLEQEIIKFNEEVRVELESIRSYKEAA